MADILLIEDNPADVLLTIEAFKECKGEHTIFSLSDGVAAIEHINTIIREQQKMPDLILLDLNLPKKDGRQVLKEIKTKAELQSTPVIILSTSKNEKDVSETYKLNANCYIIKPVELESFIKIIEGIEKFWFNTVKLPRNSILAVA